MRLDHVAADVVQATQPVHETLRLDGGDAPDFGRAGARRVHRIKTVDVEGEIDRPRTDDTPYLGNHGIHADARELIQYLSCQDAASVNTLFLVHGEDTAKTAFKSRLITLGYTDVQLPQPGVSYKLD